MSKKVQLISKLKTEVNCIPKNHEALTIRRTVGGWSNLIVSLTVRYPGFLTASQISWQEFQITLTGVPAQPLVEWLTTTKKINYDLEINSRISFAI